jgi:hypothetical protein
MTTGWARQPYHKRSEYSTEPGEQSQHETDHRQGDGRLARRAEALIILAESASL